MRYNYKRRPTRVVSIGGVGVGGDNPVRLQSMTNTPSLDVDATAAQAIRIADAGGEIVRVTTQGVREAEALGQVRELLEKQGRHVPLVADVHFNPRAAMTAAVTAHKVRINPGNFADQLAEFLNGGLLVAQNGQLMLDQGMIEDVYVCHDICLLYTSDAADD